MRPKAMSERRAKMSDKQYSEIESAIAAYLELDALPPEVAVKAMQLVVEYGSYDPEWSHQVADDILVKSLRWFTAHRPEMAEMLKSYGNLIKWYA
jgi:hypothetical protein